MIDLLNGKIINNIIKFTIPIFFTELLQQLYTLVDSFFIGFFLDTTAFAAIGTMQSLYGLMNSLFLGISIGFSILLAHQKGENKKSEYSKTIYTLLFITILYFIIIFSSKNLLTKNFVIFMNFSKEFAEESIGYLDILLKGILLPLTSLSIGAVLRAFGDTKTPLITATLGNLINIFLDYLFIGKFQFGIKGAAYATLISQAISLLLIFILLTNIYKRKLVFMKDIGISIVYLKQAILYGTPLAAQYILLSVGTIILIKIISPLGITMMGAFTIIGRLEPFVSMLFLNLSSGLTTFTAQNFGAKQYDRIQEGLRKVLLIVLILSFISGITVTFCANLIADCFTNDIYTRIIVTNYLKITSPFLFLYGIMVVYHGFLNGIGKTVTPLFCTIISFIVIRLPLSYFCREKFGYQGIIWCVVIGWGVGLIYTIIYKTLIIKKNFLHD